MLNIILCTAPYSTRAIGNCSPVIALCRLTHTQSFVSHLVLRIFDLLHTDITRTEYTGWSSNEPWRHTGCFTSKYCDSNQLASIIIIINKLIIKNI